MLIEQWFGAVHQRRMSRRFIMCVQRKRNAGTGIGPSFEIRDQTDGVPAQVHRMHRIVSSVECRVWRAMTKIITIIIYDSSI